MLDNAWPYGTIDSLIKNFYEINSIKKKIIERAL